MQKTFSEISEIWKKEKKSMLKNQQFQCMFCC